MDTPTPQLPQRPPLLERSETFAKVAAALAKAQSGFAEIEKDMEAKIETRSGGSYRFEYASLASIRRSTNPALTANGLALLASAATRPAAALKKGDVQVARCVVAVQTELVHESGEWFRTPVLELEVDAQETKQIGAATTYFRRYQVQTLLGVAAEEDTDADGAGQRKENARSAPPPAARPPAARAAPPPATAPTPFDRTLEPGEDPPAMRETVPVTLEAVVRKAIAEKDWRGAVAGLGKIGEGPLRKELSALYEATRYPKNPTATA